MRQKARVLIGVLTSSAVEQWPSRLDFYHDGRWEGQPMQPDLEGAGLLRAFGNSSCQCKTLLSLGMMLIRANTLAFGLIGKDGPHGIIKICFGNMNFVFGSEVAPLGFWEYMFRILFRVRHALLIFEAFIFQRRLAGFWFNIVSSLSRRDEGGRQCH